MGLFRPARTVTGPHGEYWELYVSKTALPAWRWGSGGEEDDELELGLGPLGIVLWLAGTVWFGFLLPLLRVVFLLPVAVVRGRRSRAVRIEAVSTFPREEVLLWTTTDGLAPGVLDEIAAGLAQGKIVQPSGAVYCGDENA